MYNKIQFANIKTVLLTVVITYLILIIPVLVDFDFYFSAENKKIYFSISLYGFIKIISGYVEKISEGIAIHLTKSKAIIIEYKNFINVKDKVKPLKDYHFAKVQTLLELGIEKNLLLSSSIAFVINYFNCHLGSLLSTSKPYFKIDNSINIYEGKDKFNLFFSASIMLNLLMIVLSLIKMLTEKIIYAISNRKQQNKQNN